MKRDAIELRSEPPYSDFQSLVSKEEFEKYFKDRQYHYEAPLKLATLRVLERIADSLKGKDKD